MGLPTVTPLSENWHDGGFLVSQPFGHRHMDQGVLTGVAGLAGMVLGLVTAALTATSSAHGAGAAGANTGNGTMGTVTLNTLATQIGNYALVYTDATHFTVTAPDGTSATGVNGSAFSALGIGFTMTTGGTGMVAGDGFTVAVVQTVQNPTATGTANGGNTGNSTMSAVTVTGYAPDVGNYRVTFIKANTNLGTFVVETPLGHVIGSGVVGTVFKGGGVSFTIADGSSDFIEGDGFIINVGAGTGKYRQWDPDNADGSGTVAGILNAQKNASIADQPAAVVVRDCEVNQAELVWATGMSAATIAMGVAQLKTLGIICR